MYTTLIVARSNHFVFCIAFTAGFEVGVYNVHEAVGIQTVCVTLSGELDGSNVTIAVTSSTEGATAQGKIMSWYSVLM